MCLYLGFDVARAGCFDFANGYDSDLNAKRNSRCEGQSITSSTIRPMSRLARSGVVLTVTSLYNPIGFDMADMVGIVYNAKGRGVSDARWTQCFFSESMVFQLMSYARNMSKHHRWMPTIAFVEVVAVLTYKSVVGR